MRWEEQLFDLLDDWESRAEAVLGEERAWEVAEQSRAEYAEVELRARLMASVGSELVLRIAGLGELRGVLTRVATECLLITTGSRSWLIAIDAVLTVSGAHHRAVPVQAWPRTTRLGLGSALRRMGEDPTPIQVVLRDGARLEGTWRRVGRDFAELAPGAGDETRLIPFAALAAVAHAEPEAQVASGS